MAQSLENLGPVEKDVPLKRSKKKKWKSQASSPPWLEMKRKIKERRSHGR